MTAADHRPGDQAPHSGHDEEQNVFRFPNRQGRAKDRPLPFQLTREQQLGRAAEYRAMATEARTLDMRAALTQLAEPYEGFAERPATIRGKAADNRGQLAHAVERP